MLVYKFAMYTLLLSNNPCDVFTHFNVTEMHGLNLQDCMAHANTKDSAYIAGWTNYFPKESNDYSTNNESFIFINLSRCTNDIRTTALVMHECMHMSGIIYYGCWDSDEENMITWAEEQTYKIVEIINSLKQKQ